MCEKSCDVDYLEKMAFNIRKHIINTIINNGEGHAGGALSCADIIAVLYMGVMKIDPKESIGKNNDKFILSAGHKCLALYGALVEKGIISKSVLDTYNKIGSKVPAHPDMTKLPGVEFSTGSLGHGLPLGCGIALSGKMKNKDYKVNVLMGDGEQGEGTNWEAAAFAAQKKLDNLVAIIDENGLQINGTTKEVLKPTPYQDRYASFGWSVKVIDGHNVKEIYETLNSIPFEVGKPSLIVAKTIKGKGLSFAENNVKYHHWNPNKEEAEKASEELRLSEKRWTK